MGRHSARHSRQQAARRSAKPPDEKAVAKQQTTHMRSAFIFAAAVTLVVSLLLRSQLETYLGHAPPRHQCITDWSPSPAFDRYSSVAEISWDQNLDEQDQISQIVNAKRAVIINGAPISVQWTAFTKWSNSSYLSENVETLHNVRYKQSSQFINEQRSMLVEAALEQDIVNSFTESSMNLLTSEFMNHDTSSKGNGLHYYYAAAVSKDFGMVFFVVCFVFHTDTKCIYTE
jgi:hypothetical protein